MLCLPDDAAREAVALAEALGSDAPKLLDASTAHRVDPEWTYGFPEMAPDQPGKIAAVAQSQPIPAATRPARSACCARSSKRGSSRPTTRSR